MNFVEDIRSSAVEVAIAGREGGLEYFIPPEWTS